jgi:hypothetical protein
VHVVEDLLLVRRQIDHAIGDHDVDRVRGEGDVFDVPLQELDVRHAGLLAVPDREGEHLLGHVESVDLPGGPDALRGEQDVDPAAGPQVQHRFPLVELGDGGRVATAEAREHGSLREVLRVQRLVQIRAEPVPLLRARPARVAAIARGPGAVRDPRSHLRVPHPHLFAELGVVRHPASSFVANTSASRSKPSRLSE